MAIPVLFDVARIEGIRKLLQEAPERSTQRVTRPQAIRSLAGDIARLQSKGYSVGEIAAMLSGQGLEVSRGALQTYLRDARRLAPGKGRKRTPAGPTTAGSVGEVPPKGRPGSSTRRAPGLLRAADPRPAGRVPGAGAGDGTGGQAGGPTGGRAGGAAGRDAGEEGQAEQVAQGGPAKASGASARQSHSTTSGAAPVAAWSFTPREDSDDL